MSGLILMELALIIFHLSKKSIKIVNHALMIPIFLQKMIEETHLQPDGQDFNNKYL